MAPVKLTVMIANRHNTLRINNILHVKKFPLNPFITCNNQTKILTFLCEVRKLSLLTAESTSDV